MTSSNPLIKLVSLVTIEIILFWQVGLALSLDWAQSQSSDSSHKGELYSPGLEVRSDTEGIDFNVYLRSVFASIRRKFSVAIPESAKQGEVGTATVQFRIQTDGKVSDDSLKIILSSGKKDMDDACLSAVRAASPFKPLPEAFHGSFIELRETFSFNDPKHSK